MKLLGLNATSPPDGWLSCLIDALKEEEGPNVRRTYFFLDEFVNETADRVDSSLVEELKSLVRNTNIRIILFPYLTHSFLFHHTFVQNWTQFLAKYAKKMT